MPYTCPMPGCAKTGNISALFQHIQAKHPALIHTLDRAEIEAMILRRDQFPEEPMPVTIVKDQPPRWLVWIIIAIICVLVGFIGGAVAGYLCQWRTDCPDFITHRDEHAR